MKLIIVLGASSTALGQVTVFTDKASFDDAAATFLSCSFEEPAWDPFVGVNGPPEFFFNEILYRSVATDNLFVAPKGQPSFSVPPLSRVLTSSGNEEIDLVFDDPPTAVGMEFYANNGDPAIFTIELVGGDVVEWESTQPPETLGYVGFVATEEIARVTWLADFGQVINTGIDNVSTNTAGCAADVNGDGLLNILDFVAFQSAWLAQTPLGDCNGDDVYNILDFVCYQNLFQQGC